MLSEAASQHTVRDKRGARLRRDGQNLVVIVEEQEKGRFPIHGLKGVVLIGRVSTSPKALELCCEHGVTVTFLSESGRFIARVEGRSQVTSCCAGNNIGAAATPKRAAVSPGRWCSARPSINAQCYGVRCATIVTNWTSRRGHHWKRP